MASGTNQTSTDPASVERNKALCRRWIEAFNQRDDAAEAAGRTQITSPTLPRAWNPPRWTPRRGPDSGPGFPDLHLTVQDTSGTATSSHNASTPRHPYR
jgi:hypothetical protein